MSPLLVERWAKENDITAGPWKGAGLGVPGFNPWQLKASEMPNVFDDLRRHCDHWDPLDHPWWDNGRCGCTALQQEHWFTTDHDRLEWNGFKKWSLMVPAGKFAIGLTQVFFDLDSAIVIDNPE